MSLQGTLSNICSDASQIISHIHSPWSRKLIVGQDFRNMTAYAKAGMIALSKTRGELANLFIPGFWSHAGIVSLDGHIIEAKTKEGVCKTDLVDFCMINKDFICLMDPIFLSNKEKKLAAEYAESLIGTPYDFAMSLSEIKKLYCSELIYNAYLSVKNIPFVPEERLGRLTVVPNDFYAAKNKFNLIWTSESFKNLD